MTAAAEAEPSRLRHRREEAPPGGERSPGAERSPGGASSRPGRRRALGRAAGAALRCVAEVGRRAKRAAGRLRANVAEYVQRKHGRFPL